MLKDAIDCLQKFEMQWYLCDFAVHESRNPLLIMLRLRIHAVVSRRYMALSIFNERQYHVTDPLSIRFG